MTPDELKELKEELIAAISQDKRIKKEK